jgi:hypothetical protein
MLLACVSREIRQLKNLSRRLAIVRRLRVKSFRDRQRMIHMRHFVLGVLHFSHPEISCQLSGGRC